MKSSRLIHMLDGKFGKIRNIQTLEGIRSGSGYFLCDACEEEHHSQVIEFRTADENLIRIETWNCRGTDEYEVMRT